MLLEKFQPKDGPFYRTLDPALAQLHVERQAYHGGTFVGNHVHKLLKVQYRQHASIYGHNTGNTYLPHRNPPPRCCAQGLCGLLARSAQNCCPSPQKCINVSLKFFTCMLSATACSMGGSPASRPLTSLASDTLVVSVLLLHLHFSPTQRGTSKHLWHIIGNPFQMPQYCQKCTYLKTMWFPG